MSFMPDKCTKCLSAFFILIIFLGCENTDIAFEGFTSTQISSLLVGSDSLKIWQRQALFIDGNSQDLTGCNQNQTLQFSVVAEPEIDSLILFQTRVGEGCGNTDTLFFGQWQVTAGVVDTLYWLGDEQTTYRIIDLVTSQRLEYTYRENNQRIREHFTAID